MPKKGYRPQFKFDDHPTVCNFIRDGESFIRVIIGPVGSGKTTGCVCESMRLGDMQMLYPDDLYKKARIAIIRNTAPELKTTTIKSWLEWFPEEACGPMKYSSPITHRVVRRHKGEYGTPSFVPGLDIEILFIALDKPKDVKKLRSLELTAAYVNEASEVPPSIISMLKRRVGRFPPKREIAGKIYQCVRPCIIMDSNAMDEDHWLFKTMEEAPDGWEFYIQPPAVLEVERKSDKTVTCVEKNPVFRGVEFPMTDVIKAAGRLWVVNPTAENLKYLVDRYYENQLSGSKLEEIRRDVQAKFVYVQDGKPVIDNYHDESFAFDDVPILDDQPIVAGLDVGGGTLHPAAIIGQRARRGNWLIHGEIVIPEIGVERFCRAIKQGLPEIVPGREIDIAYADPACIKRDELYEVQIKDHLTAKGIPVSPAQTNDIRARIDAWRTVCERWIDGMPGLIINKAKAPKLRKGLSGGWFFKRIQIAGSERFHETPDKNEYSHPCDGGGYMLMGGGEYVKARYGKDAHELGGDTVIAETDFNVF